MKVSESMSLLSSFKQNLVSKYLFDWDEIRTEPLYGVIVSTMTNYLKHKENKTLGKIALKLVDFKGNFIMGAMVTYNKPEDTEEDSKGNWSLEFTFNEDDIKDAAVIDDTMSAEIVQIADRQADEIMSGTFTSAQFMHEMFIEAINTLKEYLLANAKEGEEFVVESDGFFIASSTVEKGEKVISIVPGADVKQMIKDDTIL